MFLQEIAPIFNTRCPLHAFLKISVPYSRSPRIPISLFYIDLMFKIFENNIRRIFSMFRPTPFRTISKKNVRYFEISRNNRFPKHLAFSNIMWSTLAPPNLNIIGFGSHGHARESENHENDWSSGLPKMNYKSY